MGNLDFSANADQLQELLSYIASQINVPTIGIGGGYAPIGAIQFFDATVAPQDWLACDGTVYNIADYPQLADWYEAQHGSKNFYGGNGTTTFAVPDLQGEFLRGTGTNSHANQGSGANVGVHQDGTIQAGYKTAGWIELLDLTKDDPYPKNTDTSTSSNSCTYVNASHDTSESVQIYTSRPTNTSFLICVKAVVAGDVYSTEERVVATWIDGKPIYQRVFKGDISNNNDIHIPTNVSVGEFVKLSGFLYNPSQDRYFSLMSMDSMGSSERHIMLQGYANNGSSSYKNIIYLQNVNSYSASGNKYIIIAQYTKTTD